MGLTRKTRPKRQFFTRKEGGGRSKPRPQRRAPPKKRAAPKKAATTKKKSAPPAKKAAKATKTAKAGKKPAAKKQQTTKKKVGLKTKNRPGRKPSKKKSKKDKKGAGAGAGSASNPLGFPSLGSLTDSDSKSSGFPGFGSNGDPGAPDPLANANKNTSANPTNPNANTNDNPNNPNAAASGNATATVIGPDNPDYANLPEECKKGPLSPCTIDANGNILYKNGKPVLGPDGNPLKSLKSSKAGKCDEDGLTSGSDPTCDPKCS